MNNKLSFILGFSLCAVMLLCAFSLTTHQGQNAITKDNVFVAFEQSSGTATTSSHNVITDIGENHTRVMHSQNQTGIENNGTIYISFGNATAGTGLTQLTTQYNRLEGTVAEWTNSGDYAYNVTVTHQFTETVNIDAVGLHWEDTGDGNLYAVANFAGGAVTFNADDNCTATWVLTFDCNS